MPEARTLHDAFLDELRDAYDAEKRSSMRRRPTRRTPTMTRNSSAPAPVVPERVRRRPVGGSGRCGRGRHGADSVTAAGCRPVTR